MKSQAMGFVLLSCLICFLGCTTISVVSTRDGFEARSPHGSDHPIVIVASGIPDRPHEEVGRVSARVRSPSMEETWPYEVLERLKDEARSLGGDALIELSVAPQSGGQSRVWSATVIAWAEESTPRKLESVSGEEAAVLEAMDRFMTAISETDLEAQAAMKTRDGMTYQWRPAEGGGMHITAYPNSYWHAPARDDGRVLRERYWSPTVMIRGGIAVVWAPYEFWIDGETSHCGVDVVDFVKVDGEWLVANAMWTVEPEACAELRPSDLSTLRPED